jgi:rubrerythrin
MCSKKNLHVAVGMNITPRFKYKRIEQECDHFKDRSRFAELPTARKIKHTPDFEKMRYFNKLGFGKGMNERSVFWTCSNCGMWTSLAHKFCSNCGAKFEAEQALKERENNV